MTIRFVGCTPAQYEINEGGAMPATSTSAGNKRDHTPWSMAFSGPRLTIPAKHTPVSGLLQLVFSYSNASSNTIGDGKLMTIGNFAIGKDANAASSPISVYSLGAAGARATKLAELYAVVTDIPILAVWQFVYTPTSLSIYVNSLLKATVTTTDTGNKSIAFGGSQAAATQFWSEVVLDDNSSNLLPKYVNFFAPASLQAGNTLTGDVAALWKNLPGQGIGGDVAGNTAEILRTATSNSGIPGSYTKKTAHLCLTTENPTLGVRIETRPTAAGAYEVAHTQAAGATATREQIRIPSNEAYAVVTDRIRATLF